MLLCLFVLLYVTKCGNSENILILTSIPSVSHHLWNHRLAISLAERGYNITMVGPDADKFNRPSNYKSIVLEGVHEAIAQDFDIDDTVNYNALEMMKLFADYEKLACTVELNTKGFKQLMDYPTNFKFDLIILDVTIGACLYPFVQKFNYPPTIGVTAFLLPPFVSSQFGNHLHPSYLPWYQFSYTNDMIFSQRVWNFIFTHFDNLYRHFIKIPELEKLLKQKFGENIDSILTLERHISLVLSNTDPNLDSAQPLTPNIIPVGGLHAVPSKQLPQDLEEIVTNATNGVILFSLGTNVRSDQLSDQKKLSILSAFSKLKQIVIWKFESDIDNFPKNVIVRKWLPQNDILGHPNTVLFVHHGGALSTHESIYHGVPMLGIPFFADQRINVHRAVERKIGVHVDFLQITPEYLLQKFEEVLKNPLYSDNIKEISRRYRDQPQTPLERAIFWTEYAMRHRGAQFLNTKARDLSSFVASSSDVILFLVFLTICSMCFIYFVVKTLLHIPRRKIVKNKIN